MRETRHRPEDEPMNHYRIYSRNGNFFAAIQAESHGEAIRIARLRWWIQEWDGVGPLYGFSEPTRAYQF